MKYILVLAGLLFVGCKLDLRASKSRMSTDPHSFSRPLHVAVKHLDLRLTVDFEARVIKGKAEWTVENIAKSDTVIFDTRQLQIQKVTVDGHEGKYELGPEQKFLGRALKVVITPSTKKVVIWYASSREAEALQWLKAQQTAGKDYPFLYTQSEAILARTWIPCQDSPGIRFTYDATVVVPRGLMALMSASNPQKVSADGVYHFKQDKRIPSYLMALAVGNLRFRAIDQRTGIYAEPVTLQKAAWEFADMGRMVEAAEKLYGSYSWGRYDVLVLPPSFPFGGMENPMLTFATPTVIAGDRSLVSLVAHELAHSWSGNLVTNATWNDFWLNEGFTVYFERRIVEEVYGTEEARMQEVLGMASLKETIEDLGPNSADTRLKGNYAGRNPDDGMTDIAYEKGYFFLKTIESAVGRPKFDAFLKRYFASHAFRSITTEDFLNELDSALLKDQSFRARVKVHDWVYEPGIPPNTPRVGSARFTMIDSILRNITHDGGKVPGLKAKVATANEQLYLVKGLPSNLITTDMAALDQEFGFTSSGNAEIQCAWYQVAIRHQYRAAYPAVERFLTTVGRRKFLIPLYKEMTKTAAGKAWAREIYKTARGNYHSVSYNTVDALLR
ncbi:M1 family metallopeptidase [Arcticibacter sp. MXS-1]|uniref:M1 family metallopeptidase n=1 Tax=Arcticibacter sp. MXS-1 TaxID=3341726 RepID=UPI0035A94CAE